MEKPKKVVKKPKFFKSTTGEFDEKQIETVQFLAGIGLTVKKIAAYFQMSKSTFERRCSIQPGIYDALEKGRAQAGAKVMKTAFDMATSGKHPIMTMFWLKCREGWKESMVIEHKDEGKGGALGADHAALSELLSLSTEELQKQADILEMELRSAGNYSIKQS